ncbi:MAG: hypothetical protein CMM25_00460 [Rhodospirillaceae bacterium]|nr:hypothetical protein [Rhodospirillaceae bacterium]|tara:strand:+ start:75 stop:530 length:456 start_codon:yes stop_codon:yes gene_type:complete
MTKIYVDGDACPVKNEIIKVSERYGVDVLIVSNTWLRNVKGRNVRSIVVPEGPDEADNWIVDQIEPNDVCVTGDIPLAKRCLEKGAATVGHKGKEFTADSIGMAIAVRDLKSELRATLSFKDTSKQFDKKDRSRFLSTLDKILFIKKRNTE